MKIFSYRQSAAWDEYVRSFPDWDVYYLCEYAVSLMLHGDGEPLLFCYEDEGARMCYAVMKRDISDDVRFQGKIGKNGYFDLETPYGYGGPLADGEFSEKSQKQFAEQLNAFCGKSGIVSQFIRFHPLLANQALFPGLSENVHIRDTVFMDTSSEAAIFANLDCKNRNMVRKARKAGLRVLGKPMADYRSFLEMYSETMQRLDADDYYDFNETYFEFMKDAFKDNAAIFYAVLDDRPVAGAVFLFGGKSMHYHLAGMHAESRSLAAGNLLIYEAALWACRNGFSRLHLGGGLNVDDSLFGFKKQFNRNGRLPFYIGRTIFIRTAYDYLLRIRKQQNPDFDAENGFMIQYRG